MHINYSIELTRHNVTPAAFLAYVRSQAKKHDIMLGIDSNYFSAGEKVNGNFWDTSYDGGTPETRPAISERIKCLPYDFQTYIRNFDGSVFNEIVEFTFDDEKTGHGYYFILSTTADPGDAEKAAASVIRYHENAARRNAETMEKNAEKITAAERRLVNGWGDENLTTSYIASLKTENSILARKNAEHAAAIKEMQAAAGSRQQAETGSGQQQAETGSGQQQAETGSGQQQAETGSRQQQAETSSGQQQAETGGGSSRRRPAAAAAGGDVVNAAAGPFRQAQKTARGKEGRKRYTRE